MIFGSRRDVAVLTHISRELISGVIEQEVLFFKINLEQSVDNIYGESMEKSYWSPLKLNCRVKRNPQEWSEKDYGTDMSRKVSFAFHKADLVSCEVRPEPGDVLEWDGMYYEIDDIIENQLFLGKDQNYRLDEDRTDKFGDSFSIVCNTHLSRYTSLNIIDRD